MRRNKRILTLYQNGVNRKQIAYRVHSNYETVKKVIQKYAGPERRAVERIWSTQRSIQIAIT
jgi:transposase